MKKKARVIAWYLPQFHPIKENDETWGKGFTEWTNVAQARPLFKGHYQPRIPADLGFYDLRMPEVREAQAKMASEAGIEGFMYWHYWFGDGKMLLEKPLEWVLESGKPDFPFCFGWANHSWSTKTWKKGGVTQAPKLIAEMKYLGEKDNRLHFEYCLKFFKDPRYIRVDNKPLFVIYSPYTFVGVEELIEQWNRWAKEEGLAGIYFVGNSLERKISIDDLLKMGFDAVSNNMRFYAEAKSKVVKSEFAQKVRRKLSEKFGLPTMVFDYWKVVKNMECDDNKRENCFPVITPGYDRTARAGKAAKIYKNATPEKFKQHVHDMLEAVKDKSSEHKIIFLDSWNEWGEGNYMEPDLKYGHAFLEALKSEIVEP